MSRDDLERGPFGQSLSLLLHKLPRGAGPFDWELERGFHLAILSEDLFELNLRPRGLSAETAALPWDAGPGVSRLLVWQKRPEDEAGWELFAGQLQAGKTWQAALILSPTSERNGALSSFLSRRVHWKGAPCAVVQVFQDSPPASFFTVEKNLFMLGRLGRRLERYTGLRRWLPW